MRQKTTSVQGPRYNDALERNVLSILLSKNESIHRAIEYGITSHAFYLLAHKAIWLVLHRGFADGELIDIATFESKVTTVPNFDKEVFEEIGGYDYLISLMQTFTSAEPLQEYCSVLIELQNQRDLLDFAQKMTAASTSGQYDSNQLIEGAVIRLQNIQNRVNVKQNDCIILPGQYSDVRAELIKKRSEVNKAVLTPWNNATEILSQGFVPGNISILAGRPKMGKTSAKINLIRYWCEQGLGVYSFTPEMGADREHDGIVACSEIPIQYLINPKDIPDGFSKHSLEKALAARELEIDSWNLTIDGHRGKSFRQVIESVKIRRNKHPVDILVIDLLGYLKDVRQASGNKADIIDGVLRNAADFAQQLSLHVHFLWQIRRSSNEKEDGKRPTLAQLKSSGAAEEVADLIMMLWRESYYDSETFNDETELIIHPQRAMGGGMPRIARLRYIEDNNELIEYQDFSDEDEQSAF